MDVQDILDRKIRELPSGPYTDGLRAVKSHIDAAVRHFARAQTDDDDQLFTDAIYRCNHAFEGSIKEAYRVLTGKDPHKKTPADIELYLASGNLLRKKVLDQFTNYRKEWRNPSTHDHTVDFDEDEALLAIVSVTVFAIVLCDQIESKVAFETAAASAAVSATDVTAPLESLLELVARIVMEFGANHIDSDSPSGSPVHDYYRLEGELAGYLSANLSSVNGIEVIQNPRMFSREADIAISKNGESVIVELKRTSRSIGLRAVIERAITQAAVYLHEPNVIGAVAFVYSNTERVYKIEPSAGALAELVRVIAPAERSRHA
jgi:hypothetical protein